MIIENHGFVQILKNLWASYKARFFFKISYGKIVTDSIEKQYKKSSNGILNSLILIISWELYITTGLLKLPVKIPFTNKKGTKLTRYVLIKSLMNILFWKDITHTEIAVIIKTQKVYSLEINKIEIKNKIIEKNLTNRELRFKILIGK